jgi:hypothetical protein
MLDEIEAASDPWKSSLLNFGFTLLRTTVDNQLMEKWIGFEKINFHWMKILNNISSNLKRSDLNTIEL